MLKDAAMIDLLNLTLWLLIYLFILYWCRLHWDKDTVSLKLDWWFVHWATTLSPTQAALQRLGTKDNFDSGWRAFYYSYLVFPPHIHKSACACAVPPSFYFSRALMHTNKYTDTPPIISHFAFQEMRLVSFWCRVCPWHWSAIRLHTLRYQLQFALQLEV